jgi:hypothetical protein
MGARLRWAKVVDREHFYIKGGKVHPGLDSEVVVDDEPGTAATFMVLRAWSDGHGTFTEQWRIESPGGTNLYQSTPRELHIASQSHIERLEDEVSDLNIEYAGDDYRVVFTLDDREVARIGFPVRVSESSRAEEEK